MIKKILNTLTNKNIDFKDYLIPLKELKSYCVYDIASLNLIPVKRDIRVVLVSIERGGNIPATLLNYSLMNQINTNSKSSRNKKNKVVLYNLHCTLSTRDSKPFNNNQSLIKLKKEIDAIIKPARFGQLPNARIYIVDDLLDTGETLNLVHKSLSDSHWYRSLHYLFCYSKIDKNSLEDELNTKIVVGKSLKTKRWLNFWYEQL